MILGLLLGTIVVKAGTPVPTIALALALARTGDTIVVESGRYREDGLVATRAVTLIGRGRPRIEGSGDRTILRVTANGVAVVGLAFAHVGSSNVEERAAIRLDRVTGCTVQDNEIRDAFFGIYGSAISGCLIADNEIIGPGRTEQSSGNGIHLWSSHDITVRGNRIAGHRDGIYLEFVTNSRMLANQSEGNRRYGLHFMFSDSCRYEQNRFAGNGAGVAVMYTHHVEMVANRFERNRGQAAYGLLLKDITDSRLDRNVFAANTTALYLEGANRVMVDSNQFSSNGWAIRVLANSENNRFEHNSFVGNAFDVATNSRGGSSRFEGNFWDRYRGYDFNGDGTGDAPFRPVRLFSLIVEQNEPSLVLLRSAFVDLLDAAERLLPILTPETMADPRPLLRAPRWS